MLASDARETAPIVSTKDSETYTEYRVGSVSRPSTEGIEAALKAH